MKKLVSKRWWSVARVVISLGLLTFVIATVGFQEIGDLILHASPVPFLIAFLLFLAGVVVRAARWRTLLTALDIQVPFRRLVYLYFSGSFFNVFLPTGFGGDVVRVLELTQDAQASAALGTVFVDRMAGLLVLFLLALLALPFASDLLPVEIQLAVGGLAVAGLVSGGLIMQGRLLRRLGNWLPGPLSLTGEGMLAQTYNAITACGWRAVGRALAISLGFNTLLITINYLAGLAVGMDISPLYFILFVPVLSTTLMLPISIGGLGVRETMAVLLFTQVGVEEAVALATSLTVYAITAATGLLGGLIYLIQSIRALRGGEGDA